MIIGLFNTFHLAEIVLNFLGDSGIKTKGYEGSETPQVLYIKGAGAPFPDWSYLAENTSIPSGIRLRSVRKLHVIYLIGVITGDGQFAARKVLFPFLQKVPFDFEVHYILRYNVMLRDTLPKPQVQASQFPMHIPYFLQNCKKGKPSKKDLPY